MVVNVSSPVLTGVGENLVSYSFFDIAEGIGYVVYYGSKGSDGNFIISPRQTYSEEIASFLAAESISDAGSVKKFDLDFDLTFNLPRIVKGVFVCNIPIGISADVLGDRDFEYFATVNVIKVVNGVEEQLGTSSSRTVVVTDLSTAADAMGFNAMTANVRVNVPNVAHFAKGEVLRFTVEGWYIGIGATADANIAIGHDPQNRNFNTADAPNEPDTGHTDLGLANEIQTGGTVTYIPTRMEFHVPFVIDTA